MRGILLSKTSPGTYSKSEGLPSKFKKELTFRMNEQITMPPFPADGVQLAMVYSPVQRFEGLYSPEEALQRGTLFEGLDKPLKEAEK